MFDKLKEKVHDWIIDNVLIPNGYLDDFEIEKRIKDMVDDVATSTVSRMDFDDLSYEVDDNVNNIYNHETRVSELEILVKNLVVENERIKEAHNSCVKRYDKIFSELKAKFLAEEVVDNSVKE